jgi:hypothetical protein
MTTRPARNRRTPTPLREDAQRTETPETDTLFDRAYWLAHCDGYRVDCGAGRLGFVERILDDGVLAVRAGRLGRRLLLVPTSEVAFIVPRAEQIWLRSTAILGSQAA